VASINVGVAPRTEEGLRVGWVAYHFPPVGGAGTQRSLKFTANLPRFGIDPVVLTGSGQQAGRWTPSDRTLIHEVPDGVEVRRLRGEPEPSGDGWSGRVERLCLTRSRWEKWWQAGVKSELLRLGDVDLLYASMSPFSSAQAVAFAASRLQVPWLAGLRDPWALDEMLAYPTRAHRLAEQRRMRKALASAAAIVLTTPEATRRVAEAFPELEGRALCIPNGFDARDFSGDIPSREDGKFRIVHTGTLHTDSSNDGASRRVRRALGGEMLGVDISTRTHLQLTEAVRALLAEGSELADRIEIHLAGVTTPRDREAVAGCPFVIFHGYLPHAESTALLRSADILFLPMQRIQPGARATIVPGKTYEYLATNQPILAAVPEGDARDILRAAGTGLICDPGDVGAMTALIRNQLVRWRDGRPASSPNEEYIRRFEHAELTARMAELMRSVAAGRAGASRSASAGLARTA
jgi:glycosyltransferase involved in cell wall biosynthesis